MFLPPYSGDTKHPRTESGKVKNQYTPKLNIAPEQWMIGIPISFWDGLFSGAMLVLGRFFCNQYEPSELRSFPGRSTGMPLIFQIIWGFSLANSIQTLNQVDSAKPVSSNTFLLLQILQAFPGMSEVKPP